MNMERLCGITFSIVLYSYREGNVRVDLSFGPSQVCYSAKEMMSTVQDPKELMHLINAFSARRCPNYFARVRKDIHKPRHYLVNIIVVVMDNIPRPYT